MATDEVTIYNLALSAVGTTSSVSDPAEDSPEAARCRLWFDTVRDKVLASAPWPDAQALSRLALVKERDFSADWVSTDPKPPWRFAYNYPSDMLRPRYMTPGFERFETGLTNSARTILTDVEDAILTYTMRQESVAAWDSELTMAIAYALAAHISIPLTGKLNRAQLNIQMANDLIADARMAAANQDDHRYDTIPDWLQARGIADYQSDRFVFPDGPMLTLQDVSKK